MLVVLCGFFVYNFTYGQMNKKIDESQKDAIYLSPFKSAKSLTREIARQRKIRPEYLGLIDSLRNKYPKDTLLLIENYDFICFGCPADYVQILNGTVLYSLKKDNATNTYKRKSENLTTFYFDAQGYYHSDIHELISEMRKGDNWISNPQKYGTENCFDGGHTFYTVLYPDNKILSMYMRCWIDKDLRKIKNNNPN